MVFLKILFLFIAVVYGVSIIVRTVYKNTIHEAHILLFAIGLVGFIVLQFNLL